MKTKGILTVVLPISLALPLYAGEIGETPNPVSAPEPLNPWQFRLEAYAWLTGLKGSTGAGPLATDIDQSFSDIMDNIKMALALRAEARHERWGFIADGFYADLGGSGSAPGPLRNDVGLDLKQFIGELSVAYRLWESPDGFIDVYGGLRYNDLSMEFYSSSNVSGIDGVSAAASERIVEGVSRRAEAVVSRKASAYQAASAARRRTIEANIGKAVLKAAKRKAEKGVKARILDIQRDSHRDNRPLNPQRIARAVRAQQAALARSTAELKLAQLRDSVGAAAANEVAGAQAKVDQAEKALAGGISKQIQNRMSNQASADQSWTDPILGVRGQWNINDRWFLAGRGDIGGFGVGSDFTWTLQATVGYQFNECVSAELGYRYMDTDYKDGSFFYDVAEAGLYTGLTFTF